MLFFYLFIIRGFFAFIFVPLVFVYFNDIKIINFLEFDLFLKRSFIPLEKESVLICLIFFSSTIIFLRILFFLFKKIKITYFYQNLHKQSILNEIILIFSFLFILSKIRLFMIPGFFDLGNWTNLVFHNQISLILSQIFFPTTLSIAICSLLLLKQSKTLFDKFILILFAVGSILSVANLQSRIWILMILAMFLVFLYKNIKDKVIKRAVIALVLTLAFFYVFLNSEFHILQNLFASNDYYLKVFDNKGVNIIERFTLDLIGRLDVYHLVNSWWDKGVMYYENNNQWGREVQIIHSSDNKTTVGLPLFITFLPTGTFLFDCGLLILLGLFVAIFFKINYLISKNLGYIFFIAIMCKFCLAWTEKRMEPMIIQTIKPSLVALFPFIYIYIRPLIIKFLNSLSFNKSVK